MNSSNFFYFFKKKQIYRTEKRNMLIIVNIQKILLYFILFLFVKNVFNIFFSEDT